jgi:hypothetical protein
MPGGRKDVGMMHLDQRDRTPRPGDLLPATGYSVHREQLDAPGTLKPDLSVQLQGTMDGERAVIDLLLEVDRTGRGAYNAAEYAAYDQFLGGCARGRAAFAPRAAHPPAGRLSSRVGPRRSRPCGVLPPGADARRRRARPLRAGRLRVPRPGAHRLRLHGMAAAGEALALRLPGLPPEVRDPETALNAELVRLTARAMVAGAARVARSVGSPPARQLARTPRARIAAAWSC